MHLPCIQLGEEEGDLGVCGIEASSRLDAQLKRGLGCTLNAREEALLEPGRGAGQVQTNLGRCHVAGGAQVIPGTIAYIPCPSVAIQMRLLELQHGCCPHEVHHEHEHHGHHHGGGCHCGTVPCTC